MHKLCHTQPISAITKHRGMHLQSLKRGVVLKVLSGQQLVTTVQVHRPARPLPTSLAQGGAVNNIAMRESVSLLCHLRLYITVLDMLRTTWEAAQAGMQRCGGVAPAPRRGRATNRVSGARRAAAVDELPAAPMGTMLPPSTCTGTSSVKPTCTTASPCKSYLMQYHPMQSH